MDTLRLLQDKAQTCAERAERTHDREVRERWRHMAERWTTAAQCRKRMLTLLQRHARNAPIKPR